jgi:hypothetical protein
MSAIRPLVSNAVPARQRQKGPFLERPLQCQKGAFLEQTAHWSSLGETVAKQSRGLKQLTEEYLRPMVFEIDFLSIGKSANTRFNRPV